MRLISVFFVFFWFVSPSVWANDSGISLLNSTLITKLHLDDIDNKGQMVGAYLVSFRNTSKKPLTRVTLLLNPSLNYTKATGPKNNLLSISSNVTAIAGYELLELNVAKVQLPEPLGAGKRTEIVVHYKGYLTNMTYMAVEGIKETLNPSFTMIRADSFGYPVFAEASRSSIDAAFAHKPFQQVAFIDYPGTNVIAGNLGISDKTLDGDNNSVTMKNPVLTGLFSAAIAPYSRLDAGPVRVSFLQANRASAQKFLAMTAGEAQRIESLLGQPSIGAELRFIEVPNGYSDSGGHGTFFREARAFDAPSIEPEILTGILDLWKVNGGGRPGHWSNGLDALVRVAVSTPQNLKTLQQSSFDDSLTFFKTDKRIGKTSLADYAIDGFSNQSDTVSTLAYAVLNSILGPEAFFEFVKELRIKVRGQYTDVQMVADFMKDNLKNKAAKKFAKNWFSSGRAGKDMAKAKSFEDLLGRYK